MEGVGKAKKKKRTEEQKSRRTEVEWGGIADTHLVCFIFKKNVKRTHYMNPTMEDYECIHIILGVEKQRVKPTEIKEDQ